MAQPAAPWVPYRDVAETIAQAIADSVGADGKHGVIDSFHPANMVAGRPMPVRAIIVDVAAPLADQIIFFASAPEEQLRALVEQAIPAAIGSLNATAATYTLGETIELDTATYAVDQCDALYLEATYDMPTPSFELRIVLGTALLESAERFLATNGFEAGEPAAQDQAVAQGDTDTGATGATPASADPDAPAPAAAAAAAAATTRSALDELDAELAAAEAEAAAARPTMPVPTMAVPAAPAGLGRQHWASLLSDVEVEVSAELGRTDLALGDITSLVADSVLTLDQIVDEPVTVYVNGTAYAQARLVVIGGEYGIEILEVLPQAAANLAPFTAVAAA